MYKATQLKTKHLNLKIGELETCICVPSDFWHFHLFLHLIMKCFTLVCIHCTTVNISVLASVPRPSPLRVIVPVLIVRGRETFEIGEGLG